MQLGAKGRARAYEFSGLRMGLGLATANRWRSNECGLR